MNQKYKYIGHLEILMLFLMLVHSCSDSREPSMDSEVIPWCVVTFDSEARSPYERIKMLKKMGFSQYGYELRTGYPVNLREEIELAEKNDLQIISVFLWLNAERDTLGRLSTVNNQILETLRVVKKKPVLWLSFSNNFFEGLNHKESLALAQDYVKFIHKKARESGCGIAFYNHEGWFGNPYNQVEIIENLNSDSIKIVYNFHHAHKFIYEFSDVAKKIKPYLYHVNLNGMMKDGPQILTLGEGDHEYEMIQTLVNEGFEGTWGILGHIENEDVQKVLKRNFKGFMNLKRKIDNG